MSYWHIFIQNKIRFFEKFLSFLHLVNKLVKKWMSGHYIQTQNTAITHVIAIANVNLAIIANVIATFNTIKKLI